MRRRVVVLPEAEEEFAEAADWCDERRPGLGVEFVAEVDEAFAAIAERPEAAPTYLETRPVVSTTAASPFSLRDLLPVT